MKKNHSLDVQIGGNHYKKFVIQPVEFPSHDKPVVQNKAGEG